MVEARRFRAEPQKRQEAWIALGVVVAVTLLLALLLTAGAPSLLHFALVYLAVGAICLPVAWVLCSRALGSTTVTQRGLTVRRGWLPKRVRWARITALDVVHVQNRGSHSYYLVAHRAHRGKVLLAGLVADDPHRPQFRKSVREIRAAWRRSR